MVIYERHTTRIEVKVEGEWFPVCESERQAAAEIVIAALEAHSQPEHWKEFRMVPHVERVTATIEHDTNTYLATKE